MPEPLPIDVNAFGLYIYLWGFFSMVHLPSAMVSTGKWNHRPPFTDPSLREVPIGGYFLHSWPAYPADSTSLGRYRPSVRMASGNAILAPSLSVITFYESYLYRFSLRSPTSSNPLWKRRMSLLFFYAGWYRQRSFSMRLSSFCLMVSFGLNGIL